jgi:glycosyltransferase involved in cell wall biosynthesis
MPSILHLLPTSADAQTRQLHEMLTDKLGGEFESTTSTLGHGGDFRNIPTAMYLLRDQHPDLVFAWGTSALAAAVLGSKRRILFHPDRFLGPRSLRWVRSLMGQRSGVHMVSPTATQRRLAIANGIAPERCHLIRPGIDFTRLRARDPKLRHSLGLTDIDYVLIAPGESTLPAGHDQAVWAAGILNVLDPACKLLLWGRGPRTEFARELGRRLQQTQMLTFAEPLLGRTTEFEELLSVADACLIAAAGAVPTLPIITTMAAGVPIVSTATSILAEQLRDSDTALLVARRSPRALAQRILDLRENPSLRRTITDNARNEVNRRFSMETMLQEYRQLIEQITAESFSNRTVSRATHSWRVASDRTGI